MILTREEKIMRAALDAEIADMVSQTRRLRAAKRKIEMTGYQRARRAKQKEHP